MNAHEEAMTLRPLERWGGLIRYRLQVHGGAHLPARGAALLASHRRSRWDRALIARALRSAAGPDAASRLRFHAAGPGVAGRARRDLLDGRIVCLFAEEPPLHRGRLGRFTREIETAVHGLAVPVIPVALDLPGGLLHGGRGGWRRTAAVAFGEPLPAPASTWRARRAVQELQADLLAARRVRGQTLPVKFLESARRHPFRRLLADSSSRRLSCLQALAGALALRGRLRNTLAGEGRVGVLLPPSVPAAVVNAALSLLGKVVVNLNYSCGRELVDVCLRRGGLRVVVSSRVFLERLGWPEPPGFVAMEDLAAGISRVARWRALAAGVLLPAGVLGRRLRVPLDPAAPAAILYSSGSTGEPKGVVLSHFNVLSNIHALLEAFELGPQDRAVGVLPFFHAFGYTCTLWFPLATAHGVLYHPDPRQGREVGRLVREHGGTILVCPPTFLQLYLRQCEPEDLRGLRFVVAGAEKLKPAVARAFEERFGVPLLEGYGATELSPVVSIDTLPLEGAPRGAGPATGSLGHPVPGVAVKVVGIETGEELEAGEEGILCVKGPNVMAGYLDDPERTAAVLRDGWYVTGDVGRVGEDGFLEITDRLSRFSKLGGEMVPHVKVESALSEEVPGVRFAVTALPDERKGERLVVLHTSFPSGVAAGELCARLRDRGLPNLWIPRPECFVEVADIPLLPSGKLDLRGIRELAEEAAAIRGQGEV